MSLQTTTVVSSRGSVRLTFAAAFLSVALAQTAYAVPGALNGAFASEFHATGAGLTWITAIFEIGIVAFELTFGLLGDLFGRKKLLVAGAGLVVVGAALSAIAADIGFMIFAQAVIGVGAGLLFPIGLAMVSALTPDRRQRSRVIAKWAGFLSLGAVISPVMAGLTAQFFTVPAAAPGESAAFSGWRVSYWIIAVVAVALMAMAAASRDSSSPAGRRLDLPGQVTFALGLIAVLYATVTAVDHGFTHVPVIVAYIIGVLLLVAFVIIEKRSPAPLLHLELFRNRTFSIAAIVAVTGMFAFLAICFSTSITVGALAQEPVWVIGVLFVMIQGPAFLLSPIVGRLIHSVQPRWLLSVGFALIGIAGIWISSFSLGVPARFGGTEWTAFIAPLLVLGVGFALTIGSVTAVAVNTVPEHQIGMASATTSLMRDLGFTLGPVIGSVIAFGLGAAAFAVPVVAALQGAGLPAEAVQGLSQIPPLAWLSGWDGVVAQFSGEMLASGAPQAAVDGAAAALTGAQAEIMGAAGSSLGGGYSVVYLVAGITAIASAALTLFIPVRTRAERDA
ncbi:MAG: MFS transporter [Microbacterium sp.]|uniref:MFS transporter n=1 Tax=Microbacterium sp. TaxID=51671 RepID=UPI00260459E7|nr:MFS transporter [Microbacterium sp.]MCX6501786.1 MFS transporter [Microbacterium sp.]